MANKKNRNQAKAQKSARKHAKQAARQKQIRAQRHHEKQVLASRNQLIASLQKAHFEARREEAQEAPVVPQQPKILHNKSKIPFEVVIDGRRAVEKTEAVASSHDLASGLVSQVFTKGNSAKDAQRVFEQVEALASQVKQEEAQAAKTSKAPAKETKKAPAKKAATKAASANKDLVQPEQVTFPKLAGKADVATVKAQLAQLQASQPSALKDADAKFFTLEDKLPAYGRSKFATRNAEYKLKAAEGEAPAKKRKSAEVVYEDGALNAPAFGGVVGLGVSYKAKPNNMILCKEVAVASEYDAFYNAIFADLMQVAANSKAEVANAKAVLEAIPGFDYALVDKALSFMGELMAAGKANLALVVEAVQFLAGQRKYFSPLALYYLVTLFDEFKVEGFKRAVMFALLNVNYAEESNFDALANSVGYAKASAATKNALMENPFPLFFPSHRVGLKSKTKNEDGSVNTGGYVLGEAVKQELQDLEAKFVQQFPNLAKYDVYAQAFKRS